MLHLLSNRKFEIFVYLSIACINYKQNNNEFVSSNSIKPC